MKRRTQSGTTLLELLIAVTLVSLIAVAIMTSMRVGLSAMNKTNDRLMLNRRVASVQRIIDSEIGGIVPVAAECRGMNPDRPGPKYSFFEGTQEEMRFVSSYSLQEGARGYPRVLEFRVIPGEYKAGEQRPGVRLIVNELFYAGPLSLGPLCMAVMPGLDGSPVPRMRAVEAGPASFVLADHLEYCRLAYREARPQPEYERWSPEWRNGNLPTAIRIEMGPLSPDPSRLQLSTLTIPVRVNKRITDEYLDDPPK